MAVIAGVTEERRLRNKETMAGTKKETEKKETGQECRIDTAAAELKKICRIYFCTESRLWLWKSCLGGAALLPIMITDTKSNFAKAELKKKLKISMKSFFFVN